MDFTTLFFSFDGRIGRQQWWIGVIIAWVAVALVSGALSMIAGVPVFRGGMGFGPAPASRLLMLAALVAYGWAILALAAKRWHDRDKSAWWILINLVPVIGGLWALIENGFLRGTDGPNRFGSDPLSE
jgi:uncharacterized membrane protein YhaH (DUF805 family)